MTEFPAKIGDDSLTVIKFDGHMRPYVKGKFIRFKERKPAGNYYKVQWQTGVIREVPNDQQNHYSIDRI